MMMKLSADKAVAPLTGRAVLIWLLAFFGVIITVNMIMMKLAAETLPGTEVDSAYRASLAYQSEIAAAREQSERDWRVTADVVRTEDGLVRVNVIARDRQGVPVSRTAFAATLARPADKRADRSVALTADGAGVYHGVLQHVSAGQWDLTIEASDAGGRVFRSIHRVVLQ